MKNIPGIPLKSALGIVLGYSLSARPKRTNKKQVCLQYMQFLRDEYFAYTLEVSTVTQRVS